MEWEKPYLIELAAYGTPEIGSLTVAEEKWGVPFQVKRIFWTIGTPESIVRGRHAHHQTEQIIIAVAGRIVVTTELVDGKMEFFVLNRPNLGVYVPPNVWHTMQYSLEAVQLVLASSDYQEKDYVRDYAQFKKNGRLPDVFKQ